MTIAQKPEKPALKPEAPSEAEQPGAGKKKYDDDTLLSLAANAAEEAEEAAEGAPMWALTYGDMMSLLLVFFILLFSMSEIKLAKFVSAAESLREGFGLDPMKSEATIHKGEETQDTTQSQIQNEFKKVESKLNEFININELASIMDLKTDSTRVILCVKDVALFQPASAEITPENQWMVDKLVTLAEEIDVPMVVAGHTDSNPINSERFPSNWELSSARASRIARKLIKQGYDPKKIFVEGHAEFRPLALNETYEGRAQNRRVELLYAKDKVAEKVLAGNLVKSHSDTAGRTPTGTIRADSLKTNVRDSLRMKKS